MNGRRYMLRVPGLIFVIAGLMRIPVSGQSAQWNPPGVTSGNIYYNGGNVGIGTPTPAYKLDVLDTATGAPVQLDIKNSSAASRTAIQLQNDQGNALFLQVGGSNYMATSVQNVAGIASQGATVSSFMIASNWEAPSGGTTPIKFVAGGYNNAPTLTVTAGGPGKVGIGTTNPQYLLSVSGTIGAKEFLVTNTGWSDYVFQPGYRLRPLGEVRAFILANHHLPDIPSEAEVKEKGVSVGEMQVKLLAKVEELTLHMIQAEERNDRLEQQNRELRERLARLERRAAGIRAAVK
jgi:hypothetical protein